jgi:hypothetical protein
MTSFSSPKARRIGVMLALCIAIEASAPAPASAWFGWLDRWSGPGKFWGLLYEARLVCFGPDSGIAEVVAPYERAQMSTQLVLGRQQPAAPAASQASQQAATAPAQQAEGVQAAAAAARRMVVTDWQTALTALQAAQIRWNAPNISETRRVLADVQAFVKMEGNIEFSALVTDAEKVMREGIESRAGKMVTVAATGMFWSACSDEKDRRVSIELNVNDWHSFDNENNAKFSGGESIRFVTVMPSVTWRMFANQKADVIDLGIAAGYYAFSSKGFKSVDGFIIEPLRIDLHAPSSWAAYKRTDPKRLASMVTFRFGLMTIPGGFAADAFARGSHVGPIEAEMVPTVGLFFNLNSLLVNKPLGGKNP